MKLGDNQSLWLKIQAISVTLLVLLGLLKAFVHSNIIHTIIEIYLFIIVILLIPFVKGFIKYISIILFVIGSIVLIINNSGFEVWLSSISINHMLVSLFVATPLLGAPFKSQKFLDALEGLYIKYLYRPTLFSAVTQMFSHITAVVLNIGAISIFLHLSTSNPYVKSNRLISAALIRGLAGSIIWSPFFAAMALIVSQLPIEWITILPFLLGYVLIFFVISIVIEYLHIRTSFASNNNTNDSIKLDKNSFQGNKVNWKNIFEFIFLIFIIIFIVFFLKEITEIPMVPVIIITSYIFPFLYFVIKKNFQEMNQATRDYITNTIPGKKKEVVLFLVIGLFGGAIAETPFGLWLSEILINIFGEFTLGISLFIALSMIVISSIGFHPVMVATLYTTSIDPVMLNMSMTYFTVLLLGSWGVATISSPMTAVNFMISSFLKEKLVTTSFKWNFLFIITSLIALLVYLGILEKLGVI